MGSLLREHDPRELIKRDLLVSVEVSHCNHFADVLPGKVAFEHLGDFGELAGAKRLLAMLIEDKKRFEELVLRLGILQLGGHESEEFVVVDLAIHILVNVTDDVIELVLGRIQTKLLHDHLELVMLDATRLILVEQLPSLLDLILLLR